MPQLDFSLALSNLIFLISFFIFFFTTFYFVIFRKLFRIVHLSNFFTKKLEIRREISLCAKSRASARLSNEFKRILVAVKKVS